MWPGAGSNLESNPNYFLESTIETPKELRQLSTDMQYYIIYVDIVALFFVFIIMFSFCLTENECCTNDENIRSNFAIGSCYGTCVCCNDCCRHGNTNCNCNGEGGAGLLLILIIIIAIVVIYFAVKACGKHISRVISVVMLILLELVMAGMSFYTGSDTYLLKTGFLQLSYSFIFSESVSKVYVSYVLLLSLSWFDIYFTV